MIYLSTAQAIPGKSSTICMGRLLGYNGQPINQATVSTITYTLTDITIPGSPVTVANNVSVTVANAIFNNLQQGDSTWTADSSAYPGSDGQWGYNFRYVLPAAQLAPAGDRFQADFVLTMADGSQLVVSFNFATIKNYA